MLKVYLAVSLIFLSSVGVCDILTLTDGQKMNGHLISETSNIILFEGPSGQLTLPKARVKQVERSDTGDYQNAQFEAFLKKDLEDAKAFVAKCRLSEPGKEQVYQQWDKRISMVEEKEVTLRLQELQEKIASDPLNIATALDNFLDKQTDFASSNTQFAKNLGARAHLVSAMQCLDKSNALSAAEHARKSFALNPTEDALTLMQKASGKYSANVDEAFKTVLAKSPTPELALKYAQYLEDQKKVAEAYKVLCTYAPLNSVSRPELRNLYAKLISSMVENYDLMASAGFSESQLLTVMQQISPGYMEERHLILQFNTDQADPAKAKPLIDYYLKREFYGKANEQLKIHLAKAPASGLSSYSLEMQEGLALESKCYAMDFKIAELFNKSDVLIQDFMEKIPRTFYRGTLVNESVNVYSGDYNKDEFDSYETVWVTKEPAKAAQLKEIMDQRPARDKCANLFTYYNLCTLYQTSLENHLRGLGVRFDPPAMNVQNQIAVNSQNKSSADPQPIPMALVTPSAPSLPGNSVTTSVATLP